MPLVLFFHPKESWQNVYAKYLVSIFESRDTFLDPNDELVLIDLDMDGIPELLGGSVGRLTSPINEAITIRDGKIVHLKHKGAGISGEPSESRTGFSIGMWAFSVQDSNIALYRGNGHYIFIGEDGTSTLDSWSSGFYEIKLEDDTIYTKQIGYTFGLNPFNVSDGCEAEPEEYKLGTQLVSRAEYEKGLKGYFSRLEAVDSGAISIDVWRLYDFEKGVVNRQKMEEFVRSYGR
jgi:hypothetical protein